jgi:hypothetical protein
MAKGKGKFKVKGASHEPKKTRKRVAKKAAKKRMHHK